MCVCTASHKYMPILENLSAYSNKQHVNKSRNNITKH